MAERIAAGPGSKTYGILSILIQAWYKVEYLFTVHEHVFNPPPKVKSAVIRMTRNETTELGCNEKLFKLIVKTTFNQRRKTLRNSISSILDKENPLSADPIFNKRPEQLSVQEFIELTNQVEAALKNKTALENSYMLSSDVSADLIHCMRMHLRKRTRLILAGGLCLNKYSGSRGKNGSNDANAEYIAKLRKVFDDNHVGFQTAEWGKVDVGGAETIAYIMAGYGMNVIDSGMALLSMHAPWETSSKADVYEGYKGYKAFLREME